MSGTSRPSMSPAACAALTVVDRERPDLGGRRLAALGELPHLARHHGKAAAVLAGPGRLDGGVERQEVGLAGDLLHDGDLLGDGLHRLDGAAHRDAAGLGILGDWRAMASVWPAFSAFCFTLAAISSIEAEASSVEAACSVEPCDSCSAEADSSCEPAETLAAAAEASATTERSRASIVCRARPIRSWSERGLASTVRSPCAIASARPAVAFRLAVIRFMAVTRSPISSREVTVTVWPRSPIATASASATSARLRPREIVTASQVAMPKPTSSAPRQHREQDRLPSLDSALARITASVMRLAWNSARASKARIVVVLVTRILARGEGGGLDGGAGLDDGERLLERGGPGGVFLPDRLDGKPAPGGHAHELVHRPRDLLAHLLWRRLTRCSRAATLRAPVADCIWPQARSMRIWTAAVARTNSSPPGSPVRPLTSSSSSARSGDRGGTPGRVDLRPGPGVRVEPGQVRHPGWRSRAASRTCRTGRRRGAGPPRN